MYDLLNRPWNRHAEECHIGLSMSQQYEESYRKWWCPCGWFRWEPK